MSSVRRDVLRQSPDSRETSQETPVIPLRPGDGHRPKKAPTGEEDVARRRTEALRLSRQRLSLRDIGERLGVSKDTVARDIRAAKLDEAKRQTDMSRDTAGPVDETTAPADETGETPARPGWQDGDVLVIRLDEPMREALATIRAAKGQPDGEVYNVAAARGAIRALANQYRDGASK
ncbi:helix-turn-helix domain-containing protein [Streptomyces sp. NPDC090306]|uniref:helix-turn-helix domain-containing protein n=1 Tax=Streptomyces sp. NPDC090306 TaxID=3365961 RepID=UPI00380D304F